MKKTKLTGLLGVALAIVTVIALSGCDQPNGVAPEETDAPRAVEIGVESTVSAQGGGVHAKREFTREGFTRTRPEKREPTVEPSAKTFQGHEPRQGRGSLPAERQQLAPDGSNGRRGRAAANVENPGARRQAVWGRQG